MPDADDDYDVLLSEHEDETTLSCGCRLFRPFDYADDAVAIKYCSAHAAFSESLRSLPPNQDNETKPTRKTEQP